MLGAGVGMEGGMAYMRRLHYFLLNKYNGVSSFSRRRVGDTIYHLDLQTERESTLHGRGS